MLKYSNRWSVMKQIYECLKEIADEHCWRYIPYEDGKLIQLVNREGKSIAIYEHYFPINSDTSARICDDRSLQYRLLSQAQIPCDENIKFKFTSESRIVNDLEPFLSQFGSLVIKSNYRRDKFITRISNIRELEDFAHKNNTFHSVLVNRYVNYEHFYSVYMVNGIVELAFEYIKPQVIGDGQSAVWELLSRANICDYDSDIDLNRVLNSGEVLITSWRIKSPESKHAIIAESVLMQKLASLAIASARVIGVMSGTIDIYVQNDKLFVQSIDTSLNADMLLSEPENKMLVKRLYEKALRLLL